MSWKNLTLKEIWQIDDIFTKKTYLKNYQTFMEKIYPEYMEIFREKGLNFSFSKDSKEMSIQDMCDELKRFCEINCIIGNQTECHKI